MGDTVIIDDEPKPKPVEVVVVKPQSPPPKTEKVVTEKTTVTEIKRN